MGDESVPFLLDQGTTKTYQIPIAHLDYKFIEKCTDVKHLEKILRVLRSGEEGCYPELTLFCEKRIEHLDPRSRALRKDKPPATASDFTAEEWETINGELMSWVTEMNEDDKKPQFPGTLHERQDNLPPIRCSSSCLSANQHEKSQDKQRNKKNIPRDYSEWDKFDVEKECSKIDEGCEENNSKARFFSRPRLPVIEKKIDTTGMTKKEKIFIANREKEKGNEAFASGDYVEAVTYYTRSISVIPTAAAYNNKAQAEIKLRNWDSALQDCEKVLDMEPGNVKALMRRATVHNQLQNYQTAIEDLNKVLCIEPENAIAKKNLLEIEKKLKGLKPVSETQGKGKRILIQDIEDSEGDEERGENTEESERSNGDKKSGVPVRGEATAGEVAMGNTHRKFRTKGDGSKAEDGETKKQKESTESGLKKGTSEENSQKHLSDHEGEVNGYLHSYQRSETPQDEKISRSHGAGSQPVGDTSSTSLPPLAAKLKSEGNELFKSGQFGEAVLKYSEAIEYVIGLGEQSPDDLSILYSNRAACYLKEGNCSDCIQDCNRALELQPFSLKPLLRRAMAHESMERYRQAYIDYKTVLQIDSSIQAANDSANRITKTLIDQDGPSWREKLPPIPVVPVAAQLHRWDGGGFTSENKPSATDVNREEQLQMNCEKAEEKFKTLKNEGNDFIKKGKYEEAANKYSECMKLNTKECTVYTNRALCYLKLCKYEEAKQDCDHVLQIEDSNIKAFYRRALAYKGLQNYQASVDDFKRVLLIDPDVLEAKRELEEVTQLLNFDNSAVADGQQKQRKKITIQEVTDSDEQEERQFATSEDVVTDCVASKETVQMNALLQTSEKLRISEPANAYDFGQIINAVNTNKDKAACAELLTITDPKKLPMLLSNKLEGEIFLIFIQSLEYYVVGKNPGLVYQHLFYLSKAERFKVVLALLSKNEKEQVHQLFDSLSENQNHQYSWEDLESLKKVYEL
ncbi:sperm associated antigen 1 [Columba livia]|uniref:Sperm associated antigen 1 n=1 Tax=Columba livia TaxID=8932 RepID=A0A2I0MXL6_COLLI|nr:sperm-associated antigen 1 [Columba livia]XP_021136348.1 sperm-associated antigen 1 [Columba livia]XP_021136350.1 sperm-associated antigen 1 [Columba livia]XP_021136352.1 sperm-associated antigen 1 [Columba livia]PKK34413.1 sperm associated antigen 1 [Columba livia]